jgi:hypothetical protein
MLEAAISELRHHLSYSGPTQQLEGLALGDTAAAPQVLLGMALHVREEFRRRSDWTAGSPYVSANGYLKRASYVLTRYFMLCDCVVDGICKAAEMAGALTDDLRRPGVHENPFYWTLMTVFPNRMLKKSYHGTGRCMLNVEML